MVVSSVILPGVLYGAPETLEVMTGERALSGDARLVAFFRWLRREALEDGTKFTERATGAQITDPMAVDWGSFPLQEAVEAATTAK